MTLSGVTILEKSFLSSPAIFVFLTIKASNILTCSRGNLGCLQPGLFGTEGTNIGSTCTKSICTKGICAKNANIGIAMIKDICCVRDISVKSADIEKTCIQDFYFCNICFGNTYIRGVCVKGVY